MNQKLLQCSNRLIAYCTLVHKVNIGINNILILKSIHIPLLGIDYCYSIIVSGTLIPLNFEQYINFVFQDIIEF